MAVFPVWLYGFFSSGDLTFKSNTEAVEVQLMCAVASDEHSGRVITANQQAAEIITVMLLIIL